jgi:hypothetical protein
VGLLAGIQTSQTARNGTFREIESQPGIYSIGARPSLRVYCLKLLPHGLWAIHEGLTNGLDTSVYLVYD